MPRPIGLEGDLRHLAVFRPAGGDALGAARAAAVQQHHAGMLGVHPVERRPDAQVIVAVGAAGEADARSGGQQDFGLGAALGGEEVAAVDQRGGHAAVIDQEPARGRQAEPVWVSNSWAAWSRNSSKASRRSIRVSPWASRCSSSTERISEPSCSRWLRRWAVFVVVERARDALGLAVEQIDQGPEQVGQVGLEPGVGEGGGEGVEHVGERAFQGPCFRQRARVGVVGARVVAVQLQFSIPGRWMRRRGAVRRRGWGRSPCGPRSGRPRPSRPSRRSPGRRRAGRTAPLSGRSAAEDGGGRLFCLAMQSAQRSAGASCRGRGGK